MTNPDARLSREDRAVLTTLRRLEEVLTLLKEQGFLYAASVLQQHLAALRDGPAETRLTLQACPRCGGSGSLPDMRCCPLCGGGGKMLVRRMEDRARPTQAEAAVVRLTERIDEILTKDRIKTQEINILTQENRAQAAEVVTLRETLARSRNHELTGPHPECACSSCNLHHKASARLSDLVALVEDFTGWWHLNRDGSVNRTYDYIDKTVKRFAALLAASPEAPAREK
jgi:hypothetical protein